MNVNENCIEQLLIKNQLDLDKDEYILMWDYVEVYKKWESSRSIILIIR
jgi:hypothetical protein